MTEKIFDMFVAAEPFLLCILLLVGFAAAAGLVGLMVYALAYTLRAGLRELRRRKAPWRQDGLYAEMDDCDLGDVRWRRGNADDAPWRQSDLYVDGDDWELWAVQWRRTGGRIEVEYGVVNWLPGQHGYRNDFIRVFQRGVGLEEEGDRVSRVLLKGAEVRFSQTFLARDDSTPVIQVDPSYME